MGDRAFQISFNDVARPPGCSARHISPSAALGRRESGNACGNSKADGNLVRSLGAKRVQRRREINRSSTSRASVSNDRLKIKRSFEMLRGEPETGGAHTRWTGSDATLATANSVMS
jgi:hypothetical protein